MNVAFFSDSAYGNRTGIGNYTRHLFSKLRRTPDLNLIEIMPDSGGAGDFGLCETLSNGLASRSVYAWYPYATYKLRHRRDLDIIHNPAQVPGFFQTDSPQVLTIHDLVPFIFPEESKLTRTLVYQALFGATVRRAKRIIAVSDNTRRDIVRFFDVHPENIHVIPLAAEKRYQPQSAADDREMLSKYRIRPPYLLYVGTIEGRKNLHCLISAFSEIVKHGYPHNLVIVGKRGWRTQRFDEALGRFPVKGRIQLTRYMPDEALPALYRQAEVFVYPSIYEGFGLPPLEAMACGTPVVCSRASSLPEVVGDAALLFDPTDSAVLARALESVIDSPATKERLSRRGRERASRFCWSETAAKTLDVYEQVVGDATPTKKGHCLRR